MQVPFLLHPLHPGGSLVPDFLKVDAAFKHDQVHGKVVAPQMTDKKVDGGNVHDGQDGFDAMDP